jgi:hypothetical protein
VPLRIVAELLGVEAFEDQPVCSRDPSLRLKYGSGRDDPFVEVTVSGFESDLLCVTLSFIVLSLA